MSLHETTIDPVEPFGRGSPAWMRHVTSLVITVLCVMFISLLWRRLNLIPDPGLILLLTVALSAGRLCTPWPCRLRISCPPDGWGRPVAMAT